MCTKACFRDLLRSLCLQDLGLGWKKKLTVANVWFKLILQRPHEWSLIKINLHFLSIAREAGRAFQTRACVHPALLPLAAIRNGWQGERTGGEACEMLGMLNLHLSSLPKQPGVPRDSSSSLNKPEPWSISPKFSLFVRFNCWFLGFLQNAPFPLKLW